MSEEYNVFTRSSINGKWNRRYPMLVPIKVSKLARFFGFGGREPNPLTPRLSKMETVKVAEKYLNDNAVQDVEVTCEWYDGGGYGSWGAYIVWRNGRWVDGPSLPYPRD